MSTCSACGKTVLFDEQTSLGRLWHKKCLKCRECGRILNPGHDAEHLGQPYCRVPCYKQLFGIDATGDNSATMKKSYTYGGVDKEEILSRLRYYNDYYNGKTGQLEWEEENGRPLISGLLRVHWRVDKQIQFKPKDDVPIAQKMSRSFRKSYVMAINNGLETAAPQLFQIYDDSPQSKTPSETSSSNGTAPKEAPPSEEPPPRRPRLSSSDDTIVLREKRSDIRRFHTVCYKGERNNRKRFSINGHFYDGETSVFTPAHGTVTTVRVNSRNTTQEVIQALLDKFKVENKSGEFCLVEARRGGEMYRLLSTDYPLLERVLHGPDEDDTKIFIMEADAMAQVPEDVNQYVSLPEAVLKGFLGKLNNEENVAVERIRNRFARYRDKLQQRMNEIEETQSES